MIAVAGAGITALVVYADLFHSVMRSVKGVVDSGEGGGLLSIADGALLLVVTD